MQAMRPNVAGVDVHKAILAITILTGDADKEPKIHQFECNTFSEDLMAMAIVLKDHGVTEVAMESTGVYWKPVYNVWSKMGIRCTVGNARTMRNVPGRKTDMNDSHWIAQLHRFGLIKASFIPEDKFQQLRLLSRHRTNLTDDLARVKNRVQRTLEDGNIKIGSVVSDVFGVAGVKVLRKLADGVTRADLLALEVTTNIKRKDEIKKSLSNCFSNNHIFLIKELMQQYDDIKARILEVDQQLAKDMTPYAHLIDELRKIPGIDMTLAVGIIAEATNDVSNFADERKFAAWAGVAAGNNESAGKKKRSKCREGSPHFRKLLIQAAHGAKLKRGSFYRAKYNQWKFKLGSSNKAKVAVANRIARAIYKIIAGDKYKELGYMRGDPKEHKIKLLIKQLKNLGVDIYHQNHQVISSVRKMKVDQTGIVLQ